MSGSIDGNSQPSSTNIPNHSGSDENSQNRNNNQQLSVSPQSEYDLHHYEQIIRKWSLKVNFLNHQFAGWLFLLFIRLMRAILKQFSCFAHVYLKNWN